MAGGQPGARGRNTLLRGGPHAGAPVSLGGKSSVCASSGDRLIIETPGGGGYGPPPGLSAEEAQARVLCEAADQEEEFKSALAAAAHVGDVNLARDESDETRPLVQSLVAHPVCSFAFSGSLGKFKEAQETA